MTAACAELREEVAAAGRILEAQGLSEYVWGHVSARDPQGRGIWMKAAGMGFDELGVDEILLVGWDGEVLDGDGTPHRECALHSAVIEARPDVGSVVHCHPEHAIALMAADLPLQAFSHSAGIFTAPLPRYADAVGLVDTPAAGRAMAAALGDSRALLLEGHGVVTVGAGIGLAVMTAIMLERSCRLQILADSVGGVKRPYPEHEAAAHYAHTHADKHLLGAWEYLRRRDGARQGPPR